MSSWIKEKTLEEIKQEEELKIKQDEFDKRQMMLYAIEGKIKIDKTKDPPKKKVVKKKEKHRIHFYDKDGKEIFYNKDKKITEYIDPKLN